MARHGFGRGEYQYFDYPLPALVQGLRNSIYESLQPLANRWQKALDAYHEQHEEILTDGDARSAAMFTIDGSDEKTDHVWHVHQIFADEDGDHDFGIMGDVDLDATQDGGEVIFKNYRVGFIEDLLEN